jgi:hypothetical protein
MTGVHATDALDRTGKPAYAVHAADRLAGHRE